MEAEQGGRKVLWGRRRKDEDREPKELLRDCELLLAGQTGDVSDPATAALPAWVWTNLLAHASREQIRRVAYSLPQSQDPSWRRARRYLAGEILETVADDHELWRLQRSV